MHVSTVILTNHHQPLCTSPYGMHVCVYEPPPPPQVSKALAQGVTVAPAALAAAVAWSLAFHVVYLGLNCGAATVGRLPVCLCA